MARPKTEDTWRPGASTREGLKRTSCGRRSLGFREKNTQGPGSAIVRLFLNVFSLTGVECIGTNRWMANHQTPRAEGEFLLCQPRSAQSHPKPTKDSRRFTGLDRRSVPVTSGFSADSPVEQRLTSSVDRDWDGQGEGDINASVTA